MSASGIQAYAQLKLCIDPGVHKFIVSRPGAGQFGHAIVICERCGMTAEEVRA